MCAKPASGRPNCWCSGRTGKRLPAALTRGTAISTLYAAAWNVLMVPPSVLLTQSSVPTGTRRRRVLAGRGFSENLGLACAA
jgi:hypothetical protein